MVGRHVIQAVFCLLIIFIVQGTSYPVECDNLLDSRVIQREFIVYSGESSHIDKNSSKSEPDQDTVIIARNPLNRIIYSVSVYCIPVLCGVLSYKLSKYFMQLSKSFGVDFHKKEKVKLPESIGLASAISFVFGIFLFSLFFPNHKESLLIFSNTVILNTLLGYVDDTVELSWSCKFLFPALSILPLFITYTGSTYMCIPLYGIVNLGWLLYVFLFALGVYFTNAINILSGINGVECGQVLVLSGMISLDRCLFSDEKSLLSGLMGFSLFMSSFGLFLWNKYPARCFVGDVFCYFSGSSLLCIGLFGGFIKTLFLFLFPQLFNFVFSMPQLMKIIPCPRHRMPSVIYTESSDALIVPSVVSLESKFLKSRIVYGVIKLYRILGLISYTEGNGRVEVSNFTILNAILVRTGPIHEETLFKIYCTMQFIVCALVILAKCYFYSYSWGS
ncbi:UDP-N-acetylglucosamine--dolichyl-phosphate N-acetylglucosaminephosphotransferase [Nematocida ausubeli]|nr:UDP-N-acetylglucosamine--dolichyl-phosphate N-acetylglucosaminephosphotransferase [Nematocida ausubeli]